MDFQPLEKALQGKLVLPNDDDYDKLRQVFYGGIDKKPAVIVRAVNAEDVKQAILFAKDHTLELAVRSGGHSVAGYSASDGGLIVDMREMKTIDVDQQAKTVWAETGLKAGELTSELDKYNLVLGFGDTGSVGIGGITLGGGVGFLVRKFGLAIDNLLAAEIVTADGEILQVDEDNHADLFWAIRGGGGNFGVVTKFKYCLHELRECYGGMLFLPATPEVIVGVADLAEKAPNELSLIANVMPAFPLPFIPEQFHGKLSVMVLMMYAGDPKDAESVIAPFRALAEPIADMLKPMRYKDIFMPEDDSYHPTAVSRNLYLDHIDNNTASAVIDWLGRIEAPIKAFQFRVLGGAMAEVDENATAFAHRKNPIMANVAAFYDGEAEKQTKQTWVNEFSAAIDQGDHAGYVGFLGPNEQDRLLDAYPQVTLEKLKQVKAQYDPDNLFHLNFNIAPHN